MNRTQIHRFLWPLIALWLLACVGIFSLDILLGDGDGIIDKWGVNPIQFAFWGLLFGTFMWCITGKSEVLNQIGLVGMTLMGCLFIVEWVTNQNANWKHSISVVSVGGKPIVTRFDTVYFKNYVPGAQFYTYVAEEGLADTVYNEINSLGIRGPELTPKGEGIKRILLLGDSYIQADEVPLEYTVGKRLEDLLGDSVEVIQHGNSSWAPLLQLNWLRRQLPALEVDEVMVFPFHNDFFPGRWVGDEGYTPFAQFDPMGYPIGFDFSGVDEAAGRTAWNQFLSSFERWKLFQLFRARLEQNQSTDFLPADQVEFYLRLPSDEFKEAMEAATSTKNLMQVKLWGLLATFRKLNDWDEVTRKRIALSERYLTLMNEMLAQKGITLKIALIAQPWQFEGEALAQKAYYRWDNIILPPSGLAERLKQFAAKENISFVDLYPAFHHFNSISEEPLHFHADGHWTATGHRVAAEEIYRHWNMQTSVDSTALRNE